MAQKDAKYSEEMAERICEAVATMPMAMSKILKANPDFPCAQTIWRWRRENADFREKFSRAVDDQTELLDLDILEIADDETLMFEDTKDGQRVDRGYLEYKKIRLDTRKFLIGKLARKRELSIAPPSTPINVNIDLGDCVAKSTKSD